jgi:hypothetical protein
MALLIHHSCVNKMFMILFISSRSVTALRSDVQLLVSIYTQNFIIHYTFLSLKNIHKN